ncbi:MAG TPA: ABC transporter ATP-binding protein [Gemmatimonadales bacterium]|nr:ABC transporter ATP-binding protein [Gemmatimonadales bacterium]
MKGEGEAAAAFLRLESLSKRFGSFAAVDGLSLALARGETLALLGPSGSGKSTTLRLLAGFDRPDGGRIVVDGEDLTAVPPAARRFGMVFQHYALFPHLDVGQNVAFGLESLGVRGEALGRRVAAALALVDLDGFERREVGALSGGQQQRVALARALAPEPRVLLLDEPLSNLDPTLRERTRGEIRSLVHRLGMTTIIVTHEQEEAFDLGDRIAVLRGGVLQQVGTPDELYGAPSNAFVAGFVGRVSTLQARIVSLDDGATCLQVEGATWRLGREAADPPDRRAGQEVVLYLRPESLRMVSASEGLLAATVSERRFTGAQAFFRLRTDRGTQLEVVAEPRAAEVGQRVGVLPADRGIHLFGAGSS